MRQIDFLERAKKIARRSTSRFRVGAVLVRGSNIIGIGHNIQRKSHPTMYLYARPELKTFIGSHAEFIACRGLRPYDIGDKSTLYVYRVRRDGSPGCSRPCSACLSILRDKGIKKICFSLDDHGYGELNLYE